MRWYYQEFRIEYNYDYDISLIIPLSLSRFLSLSLYLYRSLFRLFTVAIVGMSLFLSLSLQKSVHAVCNSNTDIEHAAFLRSSAGELPNCIKQFVGTPRSQMDAASGISRQNDMRGQRPCSLLAATSSASASASATALARRSFGRTGRLNRLGLDLVVCCNAKHGRQSDTFIQGSPSKLRS